MFPTISPLVEYFLTPWDGKNNDSRQAKIFEATPPGASGNLFSGWRFFHGIFSMGCGAKIRPHSTIETYGLIPHFRKPPFTKG